MKKKYPLVRIEFDDHVHTTGGKSLLARCTVVGFLYGEDKDAYYLATWIADNDIHDEENTDTYAIKKQPGLVLRKIKGRFF